MLSIALFFAVAFFLCSMSAAVAAPALWVVQSPVGKVYLFGTVHLLRPDTQWRSAEMERAIADSQDLYLEIADPGDVNGAIRSLLKLGIDRDHPLSSKLSAADIAQLAQVLKTYGLGSEKAFEPMQPWAVFMMLAVVPATHSGYSPSNGVDLQIRKEFVGAGKPIRGLETGDQQVHFLADLPQATQVALLEAALKRAAAAQAPDAAPTAGTAQLDALVSTWLSGDEDALAASLNLKELSTTSLDTILVTNRNKAWANALADRLKQPGTSFVSVGAAHLVGPGGVPALLAQMGFSVSRVSVAQNETLAAAPSPSASDSPSPSPSPAPVATPIPQTLTPPAGWTKKAAPAGHAGGFKFDAMWVDPKGGGAILTGHVDTPAGMTPWDLDTLDNLLHQGMITTAGENGVKPSTRVKVCGGKEDGTYTKLTLSAVKEDVVLATSDRGYLAQYVRHANASDDPAAIQALLTLCAP